MTIGEDAHLSQESEVAQARMEGLIEDMRDQHDIAFEDLNNIEVLTLSTALNHGTQMFAQSGSEQQAAFLHGLDQHVQQEAASLFDEIEDIHEPVAESMAEQDARNSGSSNPLRTMLGRNAAPTTDSRASQAWRFGGLMILVQALAAVAHLTTGILLPSTLSGVAGVVGVASELTLAVAAVAGLAAFAFAVGRLSGSSSDG
jgi:hypothetical protein